ncbi:MAG: helix-turn-helix domain-containing protein [Candidatus Aenigmarchaeota archaeon]|nr:helix-turn-helix domain-containing protein [Candidatus Aenigmarchaeota archaeon]
MDKGVLVEAGLTENEADAYLILLELGSTTIGPVIKKSGLHRATAYAILQRLIEKGLVSYIIKAGKRYFEAADPEILLDVLQEREERLKSILPELRLRKQLSKAKQMAVVYEGTRAVKGLFETILRTLSPGEEYIVFAAVKKSDEFTGFIKNWDRRRAKKGVKMKIIFNEDAVEEIEHNRLLPHTEVKTIQKEYITPAVVNLYRNNVNIILWSDKPVAFAIESGEIADSFRNYFKMLWEQDVRTFRGEDSVKQAFEEFLNAMKRGDEYFVIGVPKMMREMNAFFTDFYRRRAERGIRVKALFNHDTRDIAAERARIPLTEIKLLPRGIVTPAVFNVYRNRTLINLWTLAQKPLAFLIESSELADSMKNYFDSFWKQDVAIHRGFEDVTGLFYSMLDKYGPGEEYQVLGANYGKGEAARKLKKWFIGYHSLRLRKGISVALLGNYTDFEILVREMELAGDRKLKLSRVASLPRNMESPMQINLYKDGVVLVLWGREPIAFSIGNKSIRDSFRIYFNQLWRLSEKALIPRG